MNTNKARDYYQLMAYQEISEAADILYRLARKINKAEEMVEWEAEALNQEAHSLRQIVSMFARTAGSEYFHGKN